MSYIKTFLADVADILIQYPNAAPQLILTPYQYSFYISNQTYIDSYVKQEQH